ncbi:MAG: WYL domain-containing protein [Dysgonamonadaceae bacterium]|jgi:predicted DNA-binding transcriptional regulator YafY|nr:WYL domain-containing protein [Dysgonamonadaceae bacterium]
MSKLETIKRYHLIINKLRVSKQATFSEICDYLHRKSEIDGLNYQISIRTFQRDVSEIGSIYGIYIKYDFSGKFYFIEEDFEPEINDRILETFDLYHALKIQEDLSPHIYLEKRRPQGTEHFYGLLHAIKNCRQITFNYQKYYKDCPENRTVSPLALKEFKNRWYLFAKAAYDGQIKCYALDRLSELEILKTSFTVDEYFDVNKHLKYCFGIITPNAEKTDEVILSFDPFQGKYIKSLPLHETQEIIRDTEDELRIRLYLYLTHDFLMELLSYGNTVKVIKPKQLITELKRIYTEALKQYT